MTVALRLLCPAMLALPVAAPAQVLYELEVNPPGTDAPYEYVELLGTPGMVASDLYFVSVDGDSTSAGSADMVVVLEAACAGPCAFGDNGLIMITGSGGHSPGTAATTVVTDAQFASGAFENGSNSFLLILSPTSPIVEGTDYDVTGDCVLELPAGAVVLDAVGWRDTLADCVYGAELMLATGEPDAATRFHADPTPLSSDAWYAGDLTGLSSDTTYGANVTPNFPDGGRLTPGLLNDPAVSDPIYGDGFESGGTGASSAEIPPH